MKSRKCTKGWVAIVTKSSVIVVECEYCPDLWKELWKHLCYYYNKDKVMLLDKISELQKQFKDTRVLGEFPKISGINCALSKPHKYTPYYVPSLKIEYMGICAWTILLKKYQSEYVML